MRNFYQILIVLEVCIVLIIHLNESGEIKLTNVICQGKNETWLAIHSCRLRALNRKKTIFNFNGTIVQPTKSIEVKAQFFKKANGYKPWLYKISIDACRFLRKPYNPVAILVYKFFKDYSNLNHSCPYVGLVTVDGLYLQYDKIPSPWPGGEYLLQLDWIIDKMEILTFYFYANVKEDF